MLQEICGAGLPQSQTKNILLTILWQNIAITLLQD